MTQAEARARVQRGAALLDGLRPGWFNRIEVLTFEMSVGCYCVLGQLEGGYLQGVNLLLGSLHAAREYGFDVDKYDETALPTFQILQAEWLEAIAQRKANADVPVVEWTHREPVKV